MLELRRARLVMRLVVVAAATLVLTACPGERSDQPPPPWQTGPQMTGTVADGVHSGKRAVYAKGTAGTPRTAQSGAGGAYTLSFTDLSGPYLLSNTVSPGGNPDLVEMASVATTIGVANVTPLTTLLASQLLGADTAGVITGFGTSSALPTGSITEGGIREAQAEVTAYLQDVFGLTLRSGSASFVETPFSPVAGDPMYDTIQDLNAKLAAGGTTLGAVAKQIAVGVQACTLEQAQLMHDGQQKRFCPVTKSALPEEADASILDYVFKDVAGEALTVRVQGDTVLGAQLALPDGQSFACSTSDCAAISLSVPASDESRTISFTQVILVGDTGSAIFDGTLSGAVPFISLPTLPCTDNRFFVIFSDHSVMADCISPGDPFGIGGTFESLIDPGRDSWAFAGNSHPGAGSRVEIVLDTGTANPTVVSVFYMDRDPETSEIRSLFACQFAACSGVTVGPATINTSVGIPIEVRTVTLDNTPLLGLSPNGTQTGATAVVRASFILLRDPSESMSYPLPAPCADSTEDAVAAHLPAADLTLCVPQNDTANGSIYRSTYDGGNGDLRLTIVSDAFDQIWVDLHNDALVDVFLTLGSTGEQFSCTAGCAGAGVSVSSSDVQGQHSVTFTSAVLHRVQSFPLPGDLTATITGGPFVVPPP